MVARNRTQKSGSTSTGDDPAGLGFVTTYDCLEVAKTPKSLKKHPGSWIYQRYLRKHVTKAESDVFSLYSV